MKAVLISIQPKWVKKIASGEKTIEVRKTKPKLERPFKCYIYCTKKDYDKVFCVDKFMHKVFLNGKGKGKVIGEFVCDKIIDIEFTKPFLYYGKKMFHSNNCCKEACLSYIELEDYLGNKDGYGWHISDLKIYDKPKDLGEFKTCNKCKYGKIENKTCFDCDGYKIARPPQSWCYLEVKE